MKFSLCVSIHPWARLMQRLNSCIWVLVTTTNASIQLQPPNCLTHSLAQVYSTLSRKLGTSRRRLVRLVVLPCIFIKSLLKAHLLSSSWLLFYPQHPHSKHIHSHTHTYAKTSTDQETIIRAHPCPDGPTSTLHLCQPPHTCTAALAGTWRRITMGVRHFPIIEHQLNTPP